MTQRKGRAAQTKPLPSPPAYLDHKAKLVYEALVAVLDEEGTIGQTDPGLIEMYAIQHTLMARAYEELATMPLIDRSDANGRLFANPLHRMIDMATAKLRQVIADLGLSPTAAKQVEYKLPKSTEVSKWAGLIED